MVTSPAAMISTDDWAEKERTFVVVLLSVAAAAAVLLVLAVTTLAIVLCMCRACTAMSPRRPVRPFELTLVTTHAARTWIMIGHQQVIYCVAAAGASHSRETKLCRDHEHRNMGQRKSALLS